VGVGFTTYEDFVSILAASCKSLVTDTGRVILESMSNRHIKIYWDAYIPDCTGDFDQSDGTFSFIESSGYDNWLNNAIHLGVRDVALKLTMLNPMLRRARERRNNNIGLAFM
jgi:hypothetical protein